MLKKNNSFRFGQAVSQVHIRGAIPTLETILEESGGSPRGVLLVCDTHTEAMAISFAGSDTPLCVLESGEASKTWASVERIIQTAKAAGLGRDGLFIGIGGGVVTDLTSFAASVYMRGANLCLISTTLLGMVDASMGGKTGFDLLGIKNLVGTFFPASHVYLPLDTLATLPPLEWKSGMAELIKTAILDSPETLEKIKAFRGPFLQRVSGEANSSGAVIPILGDLIQQAVLVKGRIVEADPRETSAFDGSGSERALLNLGHTFGHALESAAGLGKLSHGEAVAWGMVRSCELGLALGITPPERAREISEIITAYGYQTEAPHPEIKDTALFMKALGGDKKTKAGIPTFVVPSAERAELVSAVSMETGLLKRILNGEIG
ncbi:3-dehydroquinate synthase [Treponema primitia ZAS-2]|uniref:3-dehydroquinate synthase n=1 Tax=Treponema primitia (strain ATCC BAA-887 / DSM 12427 / ZAS-2) TaxID=545694 RepID=F5YHU5_TREPZ|nr:3-dehydroquinate synthase family protein [Treponema primitia]AEF84006.1 3-dehydroquinate synthase [Treponema primitia ZAS-2]